MICANQDCDNETQNAYKYCLECYNRWKEQQTTSPPLKASSPAPSRRAGQWHDDAVVDILMKINANLGNINTTLQGLSLPKIEEVPEKPKKRGRSKKEDKPIPEPSDFLEGELE